MDQRARDEYRRANQELVQELGRLDVTYERWQSNLDEEARTFDHDVEVAQLLSTKRGLKRLHGSFTLPPHEVYDGRPPIERKRAKCVNPATSKSESRYVCLNVGGESFTVGRGTLAKLSGTRLGLLFTACCEEHLPRDGSNQIFLDLDPLQFRVILKWLLELKYIHPGKSFPPCPTKDVSWELQWGLRELSDYLLSAAPTAISTWDYSIARGSLVRHGDIVAPLPNITTGHNVFDGHHFPKLALDSDNEVDLIDSSNILTRADWRILGRFLSDNESDQSSYHDLKLLYRASRDGFTPGMFHQKCNHQGPTMTVIKSTGGYVFGGFTATNWTSDTGFTASDNAFLCRLSGPNVPIPSKHPLLLNEHGLPIQDAINNSSSNGPYFGRGPDLVITNWGSEYLVNMRNFGTSYSCLATNCVCLSYLGECQYTKIVDYEVFQVGDVRNVPDMLDQIIRLPNIYPEHQRLLEATKQIFLKSVAYRDSVYERCRMIQRKYQDAYNVAAAVVNLRIMHGEDQEIVELDFCGVRFTTLRSTLIFLPRTVLAVVFGKLWRTQASNLVDGRTVFEEDPDHFRLILRYLRLRRILGESLSLGPPPITGTQRPGFVRTLQYFLLDKYIKFDPFVGSSILTSHMHGVLTTMLQGLPKSDTPRLLYQASQHGLAVKTFHEKCDNQGPTVVLLKSDDGLIFGGYTELSWDSLSGDKYGVHAFLFQLDPDKVAGSKFIIRSKPEQAIHCSSKYGPIFGDSDLAIGRYGDMTRVMQIFGTTYHGVSLDGIRFGYLANTMYPKPVEIEIFSV